MFFACVCLIAVDRSVCFALYRGKNRRHNNQEVKYHGGIYKLIENHLCCGFLRCFYRAMQDLWPISLLPAFSGLRWPEVFVLRCIVHKIDVATTKR